MFRLICGILAIVERVPIKVCHRIGEIKVAGRINLQDSVAIIGALRRHKTDELIFIILFADMINACARLRIVVVLEREDKLDINGPICFILCRNIRRECLGTGSISQVCCIGEFPLNGFLKVILIRRMRCEEGFLFAAVKCQRAGAINNVSIKFFSGKRTLYGVGLIFPVTACIRINNLILVAGVEIGLVNDRVSTRIGSSCL